MRVTRHRPSPRRTWRVYLPREDRHIQLQLGDGALPCCPRCGELLEARPESRLSRHVPLDATAHDLVCRDCRRFCCIIRHTPRSLRLIRMRRFVAALRTVDAGERDGRSVALASPAAA